MKEILYKKICFFLLTVSFSLSSQTFQWAKGFGASSQDYAMSVATDISGNVYTTGCFNGSVDMDPGPGSFFLTSIGQYDIFISKLDASGNFVWAKAIGSTSFDYGNTILIDNFGDVLITGMVRGTVDLDPGPSVSTFTTLGNGDIFALKLSQAGNYIWGKLTGGVDYDNPVNSVTDNSGNLILVGYYGTSCDFDPGPSATTFTSLGWTDAFVTKWDVNGNFVWAKTIGGTAFEQSFSVATDNSGNVYCAGSFQNTVDLDPGPGTYIATSVGSDDIFVIKLDAAGNFIWAKNYGGNSDEYTYAMRLDVSGNIIMGGSFRGSLDFDPGPGTYSVTSNGQEDFFISKWDNSGNQLWTVTNGGTSTDFCYGIAIDAASNIYAAGAFSGNLDFDPGTSTYSLSSGFSKDAFAYKLDNGGNFGWVKNLGDAGEEKAYGIALTNSGSVYTAGYCELACDFNPPFGVYYNSNGLRDVFVAKYSTTSTSIQQITHNSIFKLYPNPTNNIIYINSNETLYSSEIVIYDCLGRIIQTQLILNGLNSINLKNIESGIYSYTVNSADGILQAGKICIE